MKWAAGISILSWALSGACILIAGFGFSDNAKDSPSSIIMVSADGQQARLDTVLPDNEIGLVVVTEESRKDPESAGNAVSGGVGVDSSPTESAKPTRPKAGSSKSGASKKSGSPKRSVSAPPPSASACVNINSADEAALTALKGIGPAMAAKIVEHRAANGPFRKKEDIQNVKGIGPAKFAAIVDAICL